MAFIDENAQNQFKIREKCYVFVCFDKSRHPGFGEQVQTVWHT